MIEKYNFEEKKWTKLEFYLYQGFEAGHVTSLRPNTITIIGGKIYGGECNYVHEVNLDEHTILNRQPMVHARVLSKSAYSIDRFYVLGGNKMDSPSAEYLDMKTGKWKMVEIEGMSLISNWKTYGYSKRTLYVKSGHEEMVEPSDILTDHTIRSTPNSVSNPNDSEDFASLTADSTEYPPELEGIPQ